MKEVYLDGAANTQLSKSVFKAMKPYMSPKRVGNSFAIHDFGVKNMKAVEEARETMADVLKVGADEVFFTSGATEGNNWVIKSLSIAQLLDKKERSNGVVPHIICSATEHASVLEACKEAESWGIRVTYLKGTGKCASVTAKDVESAIADGTFLVCVMSINNETGVANKVEAIAKICRKKKILTLSDCTQWMSCGGYFTKLGTIFPHVDFMTFSSHKIYGPTGVGCLIARKDVSEKLRPLMSGGAQEYGKRGGTSNVAGIVGMAQAIYDISKEDFRPMFQGFADRLVSELDGMAMLNAKPHHPNILSIRLIGCDPIGSLSSAYASMGIAVSAGSACDADHNIGTDGPALSHVLMALGLSENQILSTVRVSFTKYTTKRDIDAFVKATRNIRSMMAKMKGESE